ncbi:hypothetical protein MSAN_00548900 [Mycena sanguinolenta]|uniref:Uncharacterized protein n=1 Tax=Mycena sanguinolenta TaxID=230812 RepID=A0A8H7DID3_9AGAR|nr:hypothetical protein MSAN_00548900 [Mycena sanguinolenta]
MFPKPATIFKSTYAAITLNRVTVAFFLFSLVHCFAQGIIQSLLYAIDSEFENVVTKIVHTAEIPLKNMTYLEGSPYHWTLRMCDNVPHPGQARYPCTVIFQSGVGIDNSPDAIEYDTKESISIVQDFTRGFDIVPAFDSNNTVIGVNVESSAAQSVFLNHQCAQILVYAQEILQDSTREDITFIFFQFWLLGVSIFAVSRGSTPHILTALGSRLLIAAWSGYIVIYRTNNQAVTFQEMVSAPGSPCGVDLFPTYFGTRYAYNIADFVLSITALLLAALLSWNILKVFKAQSFKRVGAPEHVIRIYKYFMAVQAVLQLEIFVLIAATSQWVAVLTGTAISLISAHTPEYDALIIATAVLVIPWKALGWYGVRLERKPLIISFLGVSFFFVSGWAIMFYSIVYRWSFVQWPYLGCLTVASFILILASMVLGTICWRNFDKGLAEYLNAEEALAGLNFTPEVFHHSDVEKSGEKTSHSFYEYEPDFPMPTFHSADLLGGETIRKGSLTPAPMTHSRSGSAVSEMSGIMPVRGPPPSYDKPYSIRPIPF